MAFLNSIFLFALGAVIVPLLIHLFSRQRVKTVYFSSLEFLKILQRKKMRRVRLRQLILLLLRTLIVLFIVLAFARPALKGVLSAGLSTRARTSAVILLDNSFSMGMRTPQGLLFEQAKEKAIEIVELLREGDEAWFLLVSDTPVHVHHTRDFTSLRKMIEEAELSNATTNIRRAFFTAAEFLNTSKNANKEMYLITDLRRNGWSELVEGKALPLAEGMSFFLLPVAEERGENVSIDRVEFLDRLLEAGKPINLEVTLTNHSDRNRENLLVQLYVNGKRTGQTAVNIDAGRTTTAEFAAVFDTPGPVSGYVEIEEDDLFVDDRRYFAIRVPEQIKVLIISGQESDAHYLQLALNPYEATRSLVLPTVTSVDRLGRYALGEFDVVMLTNLPRLSEAQLSRLASAVARGRGLIILLGNDIDVRYYNSQLLPAFCPATLGTPVGTFGDKKAFLTFGTIDYDHPIFQGMISEKSQFESPHFYLVYDVHLSSAAQPIIQYSNGKMALAEARVEAGTALFFSTATDPEWSDLWRKGLFVPLLYRAVQYLATDLAALEEQNLVGSLVSYEIGVGGLGQEILCVDPEGAERAVEPKGSKGAFFVEYDHTRVPGVYQILSGGELSKQFTVNVDGDESDLSMIDMGTVEEVLQAVQFHSIDRHQPVEASVLKARYGRELWKQCLVIALVLMCIEMFIAREGRRNRQTAKHGSSSDRET